MSRQTTRTRKAKRETKAAESFIAEANAAIANGTAVTKPKRRRRKKDEGWPCTAEQIVEQRDTKGFSWKQVAINLDLGSPSQARKAYEELTGRPHTESIMKGKRAPRGSGYSRRKVDAPDWHDDSDQDEIEQRLTGSRIFVVRTYKGLRFEEEVHVRRVLEFTFGEDGEQPLQVWVVSDDSGAHRCFRVADIVEVR